MYPPPWLPNIKGGRDDGEGGRVDRRSVQGQGQERRVFRGKSEQRISLECDVPRDICVTTRLPYRARRALRQHEGAAVTLFPVFGGDVLRAIIHGRRTAARHAARVRHGRHAGRAERLIAPDVVRSALGGIDVGRPIFLGERRLEGLGARLVAVVPERDALPLAVALGTARRATLREPEDGLPRPAVVWLSTILAGDAERLQLQCGRSCRGLVRDSRVSGGRKRQGGSTGGWWGRSRTPSRAVRTEPVWLVPFPQLLPGIVESMALRGAGMSMAP